MTSTILGPQPPSASTENRLSFDFVLSSSRARSSSFGAIQNRFAARHLAQELGTLLHHGFELVERDPSVSIRIRHREEDLRQLLRRLRSPLDDLALGDGDRQHPQQLVAVQRTVAVVVVNAEHEQELLPVAPEDERARPFQELGLVNHAVAVRVELREDAAGQVLAAKAERSLERLRRDDLFVAGVASESALE